jgi:hypothetical protein
VAFSDDGIDVDDAQVAVQLRYNDEGLDQVPNQLEDHGKDPVWEDEFDD